MVASLSLSFAAAAAVYAAFSLLLARGLRGGSLGYVFLATALATTLWAVLGLAFSLAELPPSLFHPVTALRDAAWVGLVYLLWRLAVAGETIAAACRLPIFAIGTALGAAVVAVAVAAALWPEPAILGQIAQAAILGLVVLGLAIVESFVKSSSKSVLWAAKHLLIAFGGLFAYELFLFSEALLLRQISDATRLAQPLVAIIAVPFLAVGVTRLRDLRIAIPVSRQLVLQTTALIAAGLYLIAVAAAGFALRVLGADWGGALQLVFVVGAGLVLLLLLGSGELRAKGRRFLGRNFFEFTYDYRREWLRFVETMAGGSERLPFHERVIQAVADPLECSGGFLFLRERGDAYRLVAGWNWTPPAELPPPPAAFLSELAGLADAPLVLERGEAEDGSAASAWLRRFGDVWFVLPIAAHGRAIGFMVLGKPRAGYELTWEDRDLLKILSIQIAGYITEEQTITALAEARRFERLSKNFSFIAHDLKNIVSQLAIILQQAKKRGDNPEFMRDALDTVDHSVEKMKAMLLRLRERSEGNGLASVDLDAILADIVARKRIIVEHLAVESAPTNLKVKADPSAMAAILENLIDNARQAGGAEVEIRLRILEEGGAAVIEVVDNGPGMTPDFVQDHLFQPFSSTKSEGFGIGMYQCREWLEAWGGRLEVHTRPGQGTCVRLCLPALAPPAPAVAMPANA
jgi:putative PEP-CTERM system histidine kinase